MEVGKYGKKTGKKLESSIFAKKTKLGRLKKKWKKIKEKENSFWKTQNIVAKISDKKLKASKKFKKKAE